MNKVNWIILFLLPSLQTAENLLRNKDSNTTGLDDIIANQIQALIKSLQDYQANPNQ